MFQHLHKSKKVTVGVYVAHDDDAILGVGGKIAQHINSGDDVYVVICTDGRNSHKAVLGIADNPFFIWTKELAKDRPEVDARQVPDMPSDVVKVDTRQELRRKRRALFAMKSQVNTWPYRPWQVQEKSILDKRFIDYFLAGEEFFVPVSGPQGREGSQ